MVANWHWKLMEYFIVFQAIIANENQLTSHFDSRF